jgi:hypothetical protein
LEDYFTHQPPTTLFQPRTFLCNQAVADVRIALGETHWDRGVGGAKDEGGSVDGSENTLAMTSSPRFCASFRSRRCFSRHGARRVT